MLPKEVQPKKGFLQRGKDLVKSAVTKLKSGVKKVVSNPVVRNVAKGLAVATPIGAAAVGLKKLADRGKKIEQDKQLYEAMRASDLMKEMQQKVDDYRKRKANQ